MNIVLSTRNPSKAEQIRAVFTGGPFTIQTLAEAGIEGEAVEDGQTLADNALKKAQFAHDHRPHMSDWAMADDTGFFIEALHGAPGIHAARWAGDHKSTEEIMEHALRLLDGERNRLAQFVTVVVVIDPFRGRRCFAGNVVGSILTAPRVEPQPKMPYSSIFVPAGQSLSWAEMSVEQENAISHRGKAFRQVRAFLERVERS